MHVAFSGCSSPGEMSRSSLKSIIPYPILSPKRLSSLFPILTLPHRPPFCVSVVGLRPGGKRGNWLKLNSILCSFCWQVQSDGCKVHQKVDGSVSVYPRLKGRQHVQFPCNLGLPRYENFSIKHYWWITLRRQCSKGTL